MKIKLHRHLLFLALTLFSISALTQTQFTPYDDIPGVIKSYKPAYNDSFPLWAKMLYQYPVNYYELTQAFKSYSLQHPEEKSPEIRYYKIWQRAVEPYVLNDGSIKLPNLEAYYKNLLESQLKNAGPTHRSTTSNSDWTFLGPKETFWLNESGNPNPPDACPWQVNVYSFDVAVSNNDVVYCGTETGFLNKTTNKGENWQLVAPGYFFGGAVTAVAIDPENENIVYVAAGTQVHKTTNGGETWTPLLLAGNMFYADRLKIDPDNSNKIAAASSSGLFVSDDAGESWSRNWNMACYDVEFKPDNSDILFAISKVNGKFSVVMSTDGGNNFSPHPDFPTNITDESGGLLAVTDDNPGILLAVMLSSDYTPLLYKGVLNGVSWNWELLATGQTSDFPMNNGQGYFDLVLEISPNNQNLIFTGTTTLFKSANGGQQFTAIGGYYGNFAIHPDIQDMKLLPNGETWVSTDGGFSLSTDHFTSTSNYIALNNGLVGSDMWGFDQGWNEDIVVGGRYHNGNTALADFYQPKALRMGGAESPTGWVAQGRSRHVAFNDLGNGWILPPTAEDKPEGRFLFSKYPNMDEYGGRRSNLVFHPNYYSTIFLGEGNAFWKSSDGGVSYDMLYDFNNRVRYLQISYSNPEVFYADIVNRGLHKCTDGGITWTLKPSLTGGDYGTAYWKGRTFFAISPDDENVIYACLQNGTWSSDIGKVFRSADGGNTWEDWTGSLAEYTKCLVIQPDNNGEDLVYLFTNAENGSVARVFYRKQNMDDWETFDNNYPAGTHVNLAIPFFRDSKLRVAGNSGVWESQLQETEFSPVINPWLSKSLVNCMTDTLTFDDHSLINHDGLSWNWEIIPAPAYIDNANIRNPKVVLGAEGTYSVNFSVTKDGQTYSKYMEDVMTATTCPSIDDCDNPAEIPKEDWELVYVDSEEINYPGLAIMAFDNDPSTIWHTRWSTGDDPYPHEIQIDMGETYRLFEFILLNRQDGENGRIKEFELYISEDNLDWGEPVSVGQFENTAAPQKIILENSIVGRYFRLVGISEVNGNPWSSAAELSLVGCTDITSNIRQNQEIENLTAFPVPTNGLVSISLPAGTHFDYRIVSLEGKLVEHGSIDQAAGVKSFDLSQVKNGVYFIHLTNEIGITYRVKLVRK